MSDQPTLVFLHGVGHGHWQHKWRDALDSALSELGHPGLRGVNVVAPTYEHALHGADDDLPLPKTTVKEPSGEAARRNRRDFQLREGAIERRLGQHARGTAWQGADAVAELVVNSNLLRQASNYLRSRRIRANVLKRVLDEIPTSGTLVLVGHSLGSLIAADLLRRLPTDVRVVGMVTIGSPLSNTAVQADWLTKSLKEPPQNLDWWVNFWNPADPVTTGRGLSASFPWLVDFKIRTKVDHRVHAAATYVAAEPVAAAIGFALHGSLSKEIAPVETGLDVALNEPETVILLALRYAHLIRTKLQGEQQERWSQALRESQAQAHARLTDWAVHESRPVPSAVAALSVDLSDPSSTAREPDRIHHTDKHAAIPWLTTLLAENVVQPYEIDVPAEVRRAAVEDLTVELGLGRQFGTDTYESVRNARKVLSGNTTNWLKWAALGVGAVAVLTTGGLAAVAAPAGLAGAAALTSALAAFGPGGMIGGLLTGAALVSVGTGGIAVGLASPATSAEEVEAVVANQLAAALLRQAQRLEPDPLIWTSLVEVAIEVHREHARLDVISDSATPTLRELDRKLTTVERALNHLASEGLGPEITSTEEDEDTGTPASVAGRRERPRVAPLRLPRRAAT